MGKLTYDAILSGARPRVGLRTQHLLHLADSPLKRHKSIYASSRLPITNANDSPGFYRHPPFYKHRLDQER